MNELLEDEINADQRSNLFNATYLNQKVQELNNKARRNSTMLVSAPIPVIRRISISNVNSVENNEVIKSSTIHSGDRVKEIKQEKHFDVNVSFIDPGLLMGLPERKEDLLLKQIHKRLTDELDNITSNSACESTAKVKGLFELSINPNTNHSDFFNKGQYNGYQKGADSDHNSIFNNPVMGERSSSESFLPSISKQQVHQTLVDQRSLSVPFVGIGKNSNAINLNWKKARRLTQLIKTVKPDKSSFTGSMYANFLEAARIISNLKKKPVEEIQRMLMDISISTNEPPPLIINSKLILSYVYERMIVPPNSIFSKMASQGGSDLIKSLYCTLFWYFFCLYFQYDSEEPQNELLLIMSELYSAVGRTASSYLDTNVSKVSQISVLDRFYDFLIVFLSESLYVGFVRIFPGNVTLFTEKLRDLLDTDLTMLLSGLKLAKVSRDKRRDILIASSIEQIKSIPAADVILSEECVEPKSRKMFSSFEYPISKYIKEEKSSVKPLKENNIAPRSKWNLMGQSPMTEQFLALGGPVGKKSKFVPITTTDEQTLYGGMNTFKPIYTKKIKDDCDNLIAQVAELRKSDTIRNIKLDPQYTAANINKIKSMSKILKHNK